MSALLIFALSLGGGFLFPWWWPAVPAYAVGYWLPRTAAGAFSAGFAGAAASWLACAALLDWRNHHLLSTRIAQVFHLPHPYWLLAITALLGGVVGGMSAWAGFSLRRFYRIPALFPDASLDREPPAAGNQEPAE